MQALELCHAEDLLAIEGLKRVPGFDLATKWVMKLGVEQYCHALYMANHIRLSPRQLPKIYNLIPPICKKLNIDVPEIYLQMYPTPNAYTIGDKNNYIVITSGLLDCLASEQELVCALAHECGHIACRHVYYSTMVQMMLQFAGQYDIVRNIQEPLALAYNKWSRASELTADRVSAFVSGGVMPAIRTILRLSAGPLRYTEELNCGEYMKQMIESEGLSQGVKWQKLFRDYSELTEDHPYTATRVKELIVWSKTEMAQRLLK